MSTAKPAIQNWTSDYAAMVYLFFETLITPMVNPTAFADPAARTTGSNSRPQSGPRGPGGVGGGGPPRGDGGGGGGRAGGEGGGWRGNSGGGFMSMGDLSGGGTVDGCRATCG